MDEHMSDSGSEQEFESGEPVLPRYDLTVEELNALEADLLTAVEQKLPDAEVCAVWIDPRSRFANFVRMHEASYFPEVSEVSPEDELNTAFLAIVDMREAGRRVTHAATVMGEKFRHAPDVSDDGSQTGFFTIDSLIELGNFTAEEFKDYYATKGIDLAKSISVETNFRIGEKMEPYSGIGSADLTYVALFRALSSFEPELNGATVFATVNQKQQDSFQRIGLAAESLLGIEEYDTPEAALGVVSKPISILFDKHSIALLDNEAIKLPTVNL